MAETSGPTPRVVAQIGPLGDEIDEALRERYDVLPLWQPAGREGMGRRAFEVRAVATSVRHGCSAELIRMLPNLGAICSWGAGHETLDLNAARALGIQVSTTPDVLDNCVADLAWGLLLATARHIADADRYVRNGVWRHIGEFPLATKVSGKRLGVLGLGRIGDAIARRGVGFDMDIRYCNRSPRVNAPYGYMPSLHALAQWADFLVIACVGGAATRHLVDQHVLEALGPRGIVVNIARGTVIDEAALVNALAAGKLGGAGLDVLEREPQVPDALKSMNQVVLTPHIGSATMETRGRMSQLVLDNLEAFFATGAVLSPAEG
jgi:lactate dehydrogenase-like 2-hydroxyacid dehydrogenase